MMKYNHRVKHIIHLLETAHGVSTLRVFRRELLISIINLPDLWSLPFFNI